jgi:hypothetical protein
MTSLRIYPTVKTGYEIVYAGGVRFNTWLRGS